MHRSEAWPALRGTGVASLRQQPPSPSLLFLFLSYHSMGSGRTLKFALCEVLQFAGLCVPLFIVMQRFAIIVAKVKASAQPPGDGSTAYWLIVASSIAYVTSTALLVWVPLKYMVFMKKKFLIGRKKWWVSAAFVQMPGAWGARNAGLALFSAVSSWEPSATLTWDLTSWFESEQACRWFGLHLACEYHELASPATAFVFLPYFFLSFPSFVFVSGGLWPLYMWSCPHYPALPFSSPALRYNMLWILCHLFHLFWLH